MFENLWTLIYVDRVLRATFQSRSIVVSTVSAPPPTSVAGTRGVYYYGRDVWSVGRRDDRVFFLKILIENDSRKRAVPARVIVKASGHGTRDAAAAAALGSDENHANAAR